MASRKRPKHPSRAWGTGSVWPRKDGRWGWSYKDEGGTEPTWEAATAVCDATAHNLRRGQPTEKLKQTVLEYMEEWLKQIVLPHSPPNTAAAYRSVVNAHIKPLPIADLRLTDLAKEDVQDWVNRLIKKSSSRGGTLSPRTVRKAHAALSSALEQAIEWRRITENPAHGVKLPKVRKFVIDPYSEAEARRLLEASEGHRLSLAYWIAVTLGLRLNELLCLEWSDLKGDRLTVKGTKNLTSYRTLIVPPNLLQRIESYRAEQQRMRAAWEGEGNEWSAGDRLLVQGNSRPYDHNMVERDFKKLHKTEGLRTIRFHDLRHTAASLRLLAGEPIHSVSKLMGHSTPTQTLNTYAHVLEVMEERSADRMNAFLETITVVNPVSLDEKEEE